ncbi:MAG: radical SAM family heme chaperone HemW [Lachnospiraceae bacterium]|nr:radical SAM family heme chaperone HemW [Lachnospiraceae bacterium]
MELYIHIPFCMKKCDYCDFLSAPYPAGVRQAYTGAICEEIRFFGEKLGHPAVETIFIGGGTPTWLETHLMAEIMETVHAQFAIHEDAEISMECNPGTASREAFASYRSWGLNRLSIGLQSADDEELRLLGRVHDYSRFLKTYENARRTGISNINIDIMTSLPYQTLTKLEKTLYRVISLKPEHISAYALMVEAGTPFYDRYRQDEIAREAGFATKALPDDDESYRQSKLAQQILQEQGYERYEISNYAKWGLICRHNVGYWTRAEYLGVGLGASSLLGHIRCTNERDMDAYIAHCRELPMNPEEDSPAWASVQELSRKDEIEEFMYLGLRMTAGISRSDFQACFGQSIDVYYKEILERLREQGLIILEGGRIFLSEWGMDISNRVLAEFLLDP